jgi:hypothetical protein
MINETSAIVEGLQIFGITRLNAQALTPLFVRENGKYHQALGEPLIELPVSEP